MKIKIHVNSKYVYEAVAIAAISMVSWVMLHTIATVGLMVNSIVF